MKKLLISVIAITGILVTASAQKLDTSKVPVAIRISFASSYPAANAEWHKKGDRYKAEFKHTGHNMCAVYNASGNLEETETEIKTDELPVLATDYIKENHKDQRVKKAVKITKSNGEVMYGAEVDGGAYLVFDASGKFLRKGRD